jgi:redox-sensitive bicupin YhaK (pirin superfamily)
MVALFFTIVLGSFSRAKKGQGMMKAKKIKFNIKPEEQHWVGNGFFVHTLIHPHAKWNSHISPFLLMDYAPPKHFPATTSKNGVGEHPHRGFETVTFAVQGEVEHRDSSGGGGIIGPGDVQWMTAAKGLVHEEFHSKEFASRGGDFEMVQLWVNLPAKDKMNEPRYQALKKESFPEVKIGKTSAKIVAGEIEGKKGPALTHTPINLFSLDATEKDKVQIPLPQNSNTLVLVLRGGIHLEEKNFGEKELLIFEREGDVLDLELKENTKLLVMNGEPIEEPIAAYGPFVMNTRAELQQAVDDYNSGKMGRL